MRRGRLIGLAVVAALAALGYGGWLWWQSLKHVATDDAYVEGSIVVISAKVAGHVAELAIDDNRAVKAGDLLLRIDPRDYAAKRDQAKAAVAVALASNQATRSETQLTRETTAAQVDEARATLESARVAEQAAESGVLEARATLEAKRAATAAMSADVTGAQSTMRQNAREMERMRKLLQGGFVAQRDFAVRAAGHDWVLALDADECVSEALRSEVEALRGRGFDHAGYRIPRVAFYLGRGRFVHAYGEVRINSLSSDDAGYEEKLARTLLFGRRVLSGLPASLP